MVVLPDAGQEMARRKRRKERSFCQQLVLVPSSPVPGLEVTLWPWEQGTLSSGSWEFSGTACPCCVWSALWSITLTAGSWARGLWLAPQQFGEAQLEASLWLKQEGGSWPNLHVPKQGLRQSFVPQASHQGSNPDNSRCPHNAAVQGLQSWRWFPGNYVQICELFH